MESAQVMVPERLLPESREPDREGLQGPDQGLPQALAAPRGQRRRPAGPQAQEAPQLRVPEVEDHPAVARPLLSVGEAVMQMELAGAQLLVFRNEAHGGVNVVHRREDGNIGWIDPRNTQ